MFRGMVVSAGSGLNACGGGLVTTSVDASPNDANADASVGADADIILATPDGSAMLVDVAGCLLNHGGACNPARYDLACVRKKLGLQDGGVLTDDLLARIKGESQPCYADQIQVWCGLNCPGGGRPSHVVFEGQPHDMTTVGGFFAESATRERGSVLGFEEVARALAVHGAPERLIAWAKRSAREERRHAREMLTLASKHGVVPRPVRAASSIAASLFDFARANLVDGCVAETYSALELVWMGDHAADDLRGLFARTADDEVAHAGLAFEIHDWLLPQQTLEERERLSTELRDALRRLIEQAAIARPSALAELGLPPMTVASALAVELAACLLSIDDRAHRPLS